MGKISKIGKMSEIGKIDVVGGPDRDQHLFIPRYRHRNKKE